VRRAPRHSLLAVAAWLAAVALAVASLVLLALGSSGIFGQNAPPWIMAAVYLWYVPLPTVGALVTIRRPGNPIGPLLLAAGISVFAWYSSSAYATYALVIRPDLPGGVIALWVSDGSPLGTSTRFSCSCRCSTRTAGCSRDAGFLLGGSWAPCGWLSPLGVVLAIAVLVGSFDQNDKWASVFLIGAIALAPVMVGVAVLRYRLYDIDVLINRALVYGATTAAIAVTFFGGIVVLQAALRPLTGGSEVAVAASTLVCFALFQPIRGWVRSTVDRRFYRARYDAAQTLDAFASRLAGEVDLDAVGAELAEAVSETVRPAHVSLWLRDHA
jgi:hypothetical protein